MRLMNVLLSPQCHWGPSEEPGLPLPPGSNEHLSPIEVILSRSHGESGLYHPEVMRPPAPSVRGAAGHSYSAQLGRCQRRPGWEPTPPPLHHSNDTHRVSMELSGEPELSFPPSRKDVAPLWDFPGSPVVKTPSFHCRGHGFDPWSGELRPRRPRHGQKEKKRKKKKTWHLSLPLLDQCQRELAKIEGLNKIQSLLT